MRGERSRGTCPAGDGRAHRRGRHNATSASLLGWYVDAVACAISVDLEYPRLLQVYSKIQGYLNRCIERELPLPAAPLNPFSLFRSGVGCQRAHYQVSLAAGFNPGVMSSLLRSWNRLVVSSGTMNSYQRVSAGRVIFSVTSAPRTIGIVHWPLALVVAVCAAFRDTVPSTGSSKLLPFPCPP